MRPPRILAGVHQPRGDFMPILLGGHILIAILCAVHALRTGRQMYWLFILFAFPMLGSVVYVLTEVLPEAANSPTAHKAGIAARKALNPSREAQAALTQLEIARTPGNLKRAAEALLEIDRAHDALPLIREAASGPYSEDAPILFALARTQYANGQFAEARATLDHLRLAHPALRLPDGHLLYARTQEALGDTDGALESYASVCDYYPGPEARARWAMLLETTGQADAARARWNEITINARHAPKFAQRTHRKWIEMARSRS